MDLGNSPSLFWASDAFSLKWETWVHLFLRSPAQKSRVLSLPKAAWNDRELQSRINRTRLPSCHLPGSNVASFLNQKVEVMTHPAPRAVRRTRVTHAKLLAWESPHKRWLSSVTRPYPAPPRLYRCQCTCNHCPASCSSISIEPHPKESFSYPGWCFSQTPISGMSTHCLTLCSWECQIKCSPDCPLKLYLYN